MNIFLSPPNKNRQKSASLCDDVPFIFIFNVVPRKGDGLRHRNPLIHRNPSAIPGKTMSSTCIFNKICLNPLSLVLPHFSCVINCCTLLWTTRTYVLTSTYWIFWLFRFTHQYNHAAGKLQMKMTDNHMCLQFKTGEAEVK